MSDSALLGLRLLWGWMSQSLSRLLQPPSRQSDNLKRKVHNCCRPGMRTRHCPTHHLPRPSKSNPMLEVVNKSRPPMPLLRMAQVSVRPPAANCLDCRLHLLKAFRLAGALQPATKEAAGTSSNSGTLLTSRRGYKNIITNDLLDDPLLSVDNMRYF
jgi:hypothetical protein